MLLTFAHCKGKKKRVLFSLSFSSIIDIIFLPAIALILACVHCLLTAYQYKSNSLHYVLQSLIALKTNKPWKLKIIVEKVCISAEYVDCGCTNFSFFYQSVFVVSALDHQRASFLFYLNVLSPSGGPKHNSFQESSSTILLQSEIQYLSYILGIAVVLYCQHGCSCYYHVQHMFKVLLMGFFFPLPFFFFIF